MPAAVRGAKSGRPAAKAANCGIREPVASRQWPRDGTLVFGSASRRAKSRFDDAAHGPQIQSPAEQSGDVLIRDRLGQWTYQWAVTVDDIDHGIDLVIRGDDLLASTGRQIRMARLLGRRDPRCFFIIRCSMARRA